MLAAADLDEILTVQLAIAWAGELADSDAPRLGWWNTDLVSKYGGIALFDRIAPRTALWAAYETAREAARRCDAQHRCAYATPDHLMSLYHLGFEIDEQLEERLLTLKHAGKPPREALPRLASLPTDWAADSFAQWLAPNLAPPHTPETVQEPSGLRVLGNAPASVVERVRVFSAVLASLPSRYPCPHYRDG